MSSHLLHATLPLLSAGVDEILPGSVIALSYLDFVRGTSLDVIEAAMEKLHTVGQSQYAESKLPAKWGWLLNYSMGQNKTELMLEGTQGDAQMNTGAYPTASLKPAPKRNTQLSPGATVAIVVVCVAVLLSAGCGVFVARKKRIEKREAQKKAVAARQKAVVSGYLNDTGSMDDTASQATTTIKVSIAPMSGAGENQPLPTRATCCGSNGCSCEATDILPCLPLTPACVSFWHLRCSD